jgi:predicted transcriptional regulator
MRERNRLPRRINARLLDEIRRQGRRMNWVARQMGVSTYALWRYETGRSSPPLDWYERAAAVLGVPVEAVSPESDYPKREAA